jgi:diguanylate cyclase (GGDEF)-like protein/PAS domain S-box-containing protein
MLRISMPGLLADQDTRRIFVASGLVLVAVILIAGYVMYRIMQPQIASMAVDGLRVALDNKVELIKGRIIHSIDNTKAVSTRIFLAQSLEKLSTEELRAEGMDGIAKSAEKILVTHFSGIRIFDAADELIVDAGVNTDHAELTVELDTGPEVQAVLLWGEQFVVRNSINVLNSNGRAVGRIVTEEYAPELSRIFKEASLIGKTGDFLLCAPVKGSRGEMDCFLRGFGDNEFKRLPRMLNDQPLPMHFALDGYSGIKFIKDYRQIDVAAAHAPVAYGLGAVLKMDEEEFYDGLNQKIQEIVLCFTLLTLIGVAILYAVTQPLIIRLIDSRRISGKTHRELIQAKRDAEEVSVELKAYINAIGNLALISIADRKGRILEANDKFCEISGYVQKELVGKDHRLLNSGFHPKSFWVDMWTKVSKGQVWHQEVCNRSKSGDLYWVDSTIVPLMDASGKIERFLSVRVDITARKQKDAELKERLKESHCLHEVHACIEKGLGEEEMLQEILKVMTLAFQFPEAVAAKIELEGKTVITDNFDENSACRQLISRIKNGKENDQIKVVYMCDVPFLLPYEQHLIDEIARSLEQWHERKSAELRIVEMATHDALTGLPNRYLLQDRIKQALAQDARSQKQLAVLFVDLDHFKSVNDSLGHDVGDLLLKEVTKRLLDCVRAEDTVARQGGDEFIIVLNSIGKSIDAAKVAQKILDTLKLSFRINGNEFFIGSSIGIAVFPDDGSNAETLLKNSDVAMYHAKENGRSNFQFYTEELNKSAHERQALSVDLRYALARNEFVLYYQPLFSGVDNQLYGVEALIRWQHPERDMVAPDKFISLAEETGLIIPIGEWVIETACKQINAWQAQGYCVPRVAINLSARQFQDDRLVSNISRILKKTGVESKYIALEITESMLVDNIERVIETLSHLNEMGIHISIDDFGTGYSSLSYLKQFPINTLKIDRSFVRDIVVDKSDYAIVSAIIAMAHSLGMEVVAEGIETEEQLNILLRQKCNYFQGYYFSKPVIASGVERFLRKKAQRVNKLKVIHSKIRS